MGREITLTEYDYEKRQVNEVGKVDIYTLAKSMSDENMADLLDEWLNSYAVASKRGETVGLKMRQTHRTLQGSLVEFVLGILKGIGQQQFTDARNESAIKTAQAITRQLEDGSLRHQMFI